MCQQFFLGLDLIIDFGFNVQDFFLLLNKLKNTTILGRSFFVGFICFFESMEALGSMIGTSLPSHTKFISMSPNCLTIRLASRDVLSHCKVPYRRQVLTKTFSGSEVVLQKARSKTWGFECRCSAQEMESYVATDNTSRSLTQRKRLAVFVSGGGSNFKAIHEAAKEGLVHGDIMVLVTDKPGMFHIWTFEVLAQRNCWSLLLIKYFCSFFTSIVLPS